jgi:hypothetical protein
MNSLRCTAAVLLVLIAAPAWAQTAPTPADDQPGKEPLSTSASNITPDTQRPWAPRLPAPPVPENAPPKDFIQAALNALAAGRTGEAQEAMERAESRVLTRSVRPSRANQPSQQPLVQQLAQARQALGANNRMEAVRILQQALKNPEASETD